MTGQQCTICHKAAPRLKERRYCVPCWQAEKRIEQAYYRTCSGVTIDIMDIGKVFKAGHAALLAGADEAGLEKAVVDFVQTIRRN